MSLASPYYARLFSLLTSLLLIIGSRCALDQNELTEQELGTALLQRHMQIQSTNSSLQRGRIPDFSASEPVESYGKLRPSRLLIMLVSCQDNSVNWHNLTRWAEDVHPGGDYLILTGRPDNYTMDKPYELNIAERLLMVNVTDAYDALAHKVVAALKSIYEAPELAHITYVYKVDDTSVGKPDWYVQKEMNVSGQPLHAWERPGLGHIGGWDIQPLTPHQVRSLPGDMVDFSIIGLNATAVQAALASQPADYMTSEIGYKAIDCDLVEPKYLEWHFSRVPEDSYWDNRRQPCNWKFAYANGGFGYMLSRRALGLISKHWPWESLGDVFFQFVYEDMAVGVTLQAEGVVPTPVHLAGHTPWNSRVCPCTPNNPAEACQSYCTTSTTARCCFKPCIDQPGLCNDVQYA